MSSRKRWMPWGFFKLRSLRSSAGVKALVGLDIYEFSLVEREANSVNHRGHRGHRGGIGFRFTETNKELNRRERRERPQSSRRKSLASGFLRLGASSPTAPDGVDGDRSGSEEDQSKR